MEVPVQLKSAPDWKMVDSANHMFNQLRITNVTLTSIHYCGGVHM